MRRHDEEGGGEERRDRGRGGQRTCVVSDQHTHATHTPTPICSQGEQESEVIIQRESSVPAREDVGRGRWCGSRAPVLEKSWWMSECVVHTPHTSL